MNSGVDLICLHDRFIATNTLIILPNLTPILFTWLWISSAYTTVFRIHILTIHISQICLLLLLDLISNFYVNKHSPQVKITIKYHHEWHSSNDVLKFLSISSRCQQLIIMIRHTDVCCEYKQEIKKFFILYI